LPRNGARPQLSEKLSQRSAVDAEPDLDPPAAPTPEILRVAVVGEGFSRRVLTGSIIVSCLVHIAGAAAMLRSSSATADYGVLTQQTDAISVEMTASTILEAVDASASVAMAAAAPTATQVGNPVPSSALAVPMTNVEEAAVKEPVVETVKVSEVKPDAVAPVEDPLQVVRGTGEPSDEIATKTAQRTEESERDREKGESREGRSQRAATAVGGTGVGRRDGPLDRAGRLAGESVGEPRQSLELCRRHPGQGCAQQAGRIRGAAARCRSPLASRPQAI
jgi:hypothetical protein